MAKNTGFHNTAYKEENYSAGYKDWLTIQKPERKVTYDFWVHYHPYSDALIQRLNLQGLPGLMDVKYLESLQTNLTDFYTFNNNAVDSFQNEKIDVSDNGPYSVYNWELFFHAPLTIAIHLSNNQRFAEAQQWFHYIFDPTCNDKSVPSPQRFWKFLRFREETKPEFIQEMLLELAKSEDNELKDRMEQNIQEWRDKPFQPHRIARGRYMAYQINVIMKYLDNLIAWGDFLFRQDTIETLNEATQIYVLAANILGDKPQKMPPRRSSSPKSFAQLKAAGLDKFSNALVEMENDFPFNMSPTTTTSSVEGATETVFGVGKTLYFCIPQNKKLLSYWDLVGDRLFKIRHCMNIEGVVRKLALFQPPIDPGALVKAAAAGLDIGSIVNNLNQPVSNIRGPLLLQKAMEICNEVKALGNALLSAIEKKENEHLNVLRQQYEIKLMTSAQDVRFLQWKESESATEALVKSRNTTFERYRHYKRILGVEEENLDAYKAVELLRNDLTEENFDDAYAELVGKYNLELQNENYREESSVGGIMEFAGNIVTDVFGGELGKTLPLNKNENAELNIFLPTSDTFSTLSTALKLASPLLALLPQFDAHGTPLGVGGKVGFGGVQLSKVADGGSDIAKQVADAFRSSADRASKMAGYYRRAEDYVFQANTATSDLIQFGQQIVSSLIREQILKKEYENHLEQLEESKNIEAFMHEKFTNEELYSWMQNETSKLYFDNYKFAYDLAKKAEQTMKHELMRKEFNDIDHIKFGYWDSSRKGLLAGETLHLDCKRMEMAYHDQDKREYELTKHISLRRLDPMALLKLKATGRCEIEVPEWIYDIDSPGQYMRRIKTASISIPCITGPYTGVHCKVSILRSSIRNSSLLGDGYMRTVEDDRFSDFTGTIESIITSTGQNDSGLFETNLKDEKKLPFEGAGAISNWQLELPNDVPQFNFESISDVILHIRYKAREAGHLTGDAATFVKEDVLQAPDGLLQLFSLKHDFGNDWFRFTSANSDAERTLEISVTKESFPYWVNPLGMEDAVEASFCIIDLEKNKLTLAPNLVTLTGDEATGWTLNVDQGSEIFPFFKKYINANIYMVTSYSAKV